MAHPWLAQGGADNSSFESPLSSLKGSATVKLASCVAPAKVLALLVQLGSYNFLAGWFFGVVLGIVLQATMEACPV